MRVKTSPRQSAFHIHAAFWLVAALVLSLVAYHRLVKVYFVYDDFLHMYQIVNESWGRLLFRPFAGHWLVVSNLLWTIMYWGVGPNPSIYFGLMLSLHMIAVGLLFGLVWRLTASAPFAALAAGTWGASPVNVGALGWYSVYGQPLALVLSLLALVQAVGRSGQARVSTRTSLGWGLLFAASAASFGTGLAIAMLSPVILCLLVPAERRDRGVVRGWIVTPLCVAALYLACAWKYHQPSAFESVPGVDVFDGVRGLDLTGIVVLIERVASMSLELVSFGTSSVLLGPLFPIVSRATSGATLSTIGFWLLVAGGWWRADVRRRRAIAGLLVAALCQYAIVAAGRASLYERFKMLGAMELRYHYAPPAMLAAVAAIAAHALTMGLPARRFAAAVLVTLWLSCSTYVLVRHPIAIDLHDQARAEAAALVQEVTTSLDIAAPGMPVYMQNRPFKSIGPMALMAPEVFPGSAAVFTIFFESDVVGGHPVYFVDPNEKARTAARALRGSRIAGVLVSPDQAPASPSLEPVCRR